MCVGQIIMLKMFEIVLMSVVSHGLKKCPYCCRLYRNGEAYYRRLQGHLSS